MRDPRQDLAATRTLGDLGYRYRMWTFLAEEHESPGVFDEWSEAARYLFGFKLDRSPAEVRFARDMPLDVCYALEVNDFRGIQTLQLTVKDLRISETTA